jgi:Na+/proline symporter
MSVADWMVMLLTLLGIAALGVYKTRRQQTAGNFLTGEDLSHWTIALSVMATQASAITFLSAPGLGYESGLRFVQFYFGLPLAVVVVSAFFIPRFYQSKVFTAYAYLEGRFGLGARLFTAALFLIQRGLAAGLTIFAPAIVLSTLFGWNLPLTNVLIGLVVILYTVSGGSKAVSLTQKWQMAVILLGMLLALILLASSVVKAFGVEQTLQLAQWSGRVNPIDFSWNLNERYTVWSGLLGGFFLSLSYFGTDQSQVQRYLGGKNLKESKLGLLWNGVVKIPMQFVILSIGVFLYLFFLVNKPPVFFNETALEALRNSPGATELAQLEREYDAIHAQRATALKNENGQLADFQAWEVREKELRKEVNQLVELHVPDLAGKDTNYVFLHYVLNYLPMGLIGLLLAVILAAAMSSTSGEVSALATTTMVDFYQRLGGRVKDERHAIAISRGLTVFWGLMAIGFALVAQLFDNLIEMVNLLGSLFYGTILGVFLVAFFIRPVQGTAVLIGGVLAQSMIFILHLGQVSGWSWIEGFTTEYLWYNLLGCAAVVVFSLISQWLISGPAWRAPTKG